MVTQRLPEQNSVLVLGDKRDAEKLRNQGVPILGSVQGTDNRSRTLGTRLQRAVNKITGQKKDQVIAWGWTPTVAVSGLRGVAGVVAFVDSIDSNCIPEIDIDHVIPTSWTCRDRLEQNQTCCISVSEPLVGIAATSLVVDSNSVYNSLHISPNSMLVVIMNDVGNWQEIVELIAMTKSVGIEIQIVVSQNYRCFSELYFSLKEHGLPHLLHRIPIGLRLIDVVSAASCIWVPTSIENEKVEGVLDLLWAAACGVPVAASSSHAITGVPTIGNRLGWVTSTTALCEWFIELTRDPSVLFDQALEIAARIRSIASGARFVEGLQLRL